MTTIPIRLLRRAWLLRRLGVLLAWIIGMLPGPLPGRAPDDSAGSLPQWRERFDREVDYRLHVPEADQRKYMALLDHALAANDLAELPAQAVLLVDRSPQVQALFVVVRWTQGNGHWIGASLVSTGRPGSFDHFRTPVGVFAHGLHNPDFRAEGSFNENHVRGYGIRGMRVFDFGWVEAERGWGRGGTSAMRLQMHATDPDLLETRLGRVASKGCIRIAATLNVFLDRYGVIDHDYLQAAANAGVPWVLRADREPWPWPGRYLVIVDSQRVEPPAWVARSVPLAEPVRAAPETDRSVC